MGQQLCMFAELLEHLSHVSLQVWEGLRDAHNYCYQGAKFSWMNIQLTDLMQ
jgi:hypothetical protein